MEDEIKGQFMLTA